MSNVTHYSPSTHTIMLGDKEFTVRNLTPIFKNDEARKEAKNKIQNELFGIFRRYST